MSRDQVVQDFKEKLTHHNNQICEFQESLVPYDKDVSKRDDLKFQLHDLQQWIADVDCKVKQSNNDILNIIDKQLQKINDAEVRESMLRSENSKLLNTKECITENLNTLSRKEQTLVAEIEKLELLNMNIQNELCNAETRVDELNCNLECLKKTIKSKEEECENVQKKLTDRDVECKRLCAMGCAAKCTLERSKADVADVRSRLTKAEECLKQERAALADQLDKKCRELQDAEIELVMATRTVAELKADAEKLESVVAELGETMAREKCEVEAAARALGEENCVAAKKVCRSEDELATLRRENATTIAKIESLRGQTQANECQLAESRNAAEAIDRAKDEKCSRLERERCSLANDLQRTKKKIADLERQLCHMREESRPCGVCTSSCPVPADFCPSVNDVCSLPVIQCESNETSFNDVLKKLYTDLEYLKDKPCNTKPDKYTTPARSDRP